MTTYLYELRPLDEVKAPGRASMEITMQERASLTHTNTTATTASWGNRASASGVGLGEGPSGSAGGAGGAGPAACGRVLQASAAAAGAGAVGSGLGTPHVQDLGQRSCWKLYIVQEFCELVGVPVGYRSVAQHIQLHELMPQHECGTGACLVEGPRCVGGRRPGLSNATQQVDGIVCTSRACISHNCVFCTRADSHVRGPCLPPVLNCASPSARRAR